MNAPYRLYYFLCVKIIQRMPYHHGCARKSTMPIPDFQTIMLPLLTFARDGAEHTLRETIDALADEFQLTVDERNTLLPSGQQAVFDNRVGWARTSLKKAGLLESTRRGYYRITDRGQQVLRQNPPRIDIAFLRQFPEFIEFQRTTQFSTDDIRNENEEDRKPRTPEEMIETAYQKLRESLAAELLQLN